MTYFLGIQHIFHGPGMAVGAAAADEEDVGIAGLADLVGSRLDLGAQGKGVVYNFLVKGCIEIKQHGFVSSSCDVRPVLQNSAAA